MMKIEVRLLVLLLPILLLSAPVFGSEQEAILPDSLEQWYKPHNKRQVWLHTMFAMRREVQAVEEYLEKGDDQGVSKWGAMLTGHYRKISQMVPEWEEITEPALADRLEANIAINAVEAIRENLKAMKKRCQSCHEDYQLLAALRYRSPDFTGIRITTPDKEYRYDEYMSLLSRRVNRVRIAAEDGYWEDAGSENRQLQHELAALEENCSSCHKDEPPVERILGDSLKAALADVDLAIGEKELVTVKRKLGEAAVVACARCHGVHRTLYELREEKF
jgi:hypothetical protein